MLEDLNDDELEGLEDFVEGLLEILGYDTDDPDNLKEALRFLEDATPDELAGLPETDRQIFINDRDAILDVIRAWLELEDIFSFDDDE